MVASTWPLPTQINRRQVYYPSAKLRLTIRLDEFGQTAKLAAPPTTISKNLTGVDPSRGTLSATPTLFGPNGPVAYQLGPPGATNALLPTQQARSSDGFTYDVTVIPRSMSVRLNGIRTADEFEAEFLFVDCPIDPRTVRACAIEAFIGTIKMQDYNAGVENMNRASSAGGQEPINVLPDTWADDAGNQRTNSRFIGWVDDWEVDWQDGDDPVIRLRGRDNSCLLLDQKRPPGLMLDMTKPIHQAIALYLSKFNQMQGITVVYQGPNAAPTLKGALANTAFVPQLGPQPNGGGSSSTSVMDYLAEVCGAIGHSIYMQGTELVIVQPRTLMSNVTVRRPDDPFKGRTLSTGDRLDYRRFLYGANVLNMKMRRNFSTNLPKCIEVRSYDTGRKNVHVARFPLPADRSKIRVVPPGSAQSDQTWEVKWVRGITDDATLRQIAQAYYEQLGRKELEVNITTHNLASFGAGNTDPDILDLRAGDTFEVLIDRSKEQNRLLQIEDLLTLQESNTRYMQSLGFDADFANAYATAYTNAGFSPLWRVKELEMHWSLDDGVELRLTGVNYIEVRSNVSLAAGEETGTTGPAVSNSSENTSGF